ncbi:MAG: hypothetical protein WCQ26_09395 [Pseudanabaena sp. ELA748]
MKFFAIALAALISSTLFLDTALAIRKKNSPKSTKSKVTNVKAHAQTAPNKSKKDNWSTIGNVNPYTGKKGTKRP